MPVYKSVLRKMDHKEKILKLWTEDSVTSLQACLECTDIDSLIETISSCITFCVDSIIPEKRVAMYPNNKPWVTKELKAAINNKKMAFYTGDYLTKKGASRELKNKIREAKVEYKKKIEEWYTSGNL